MQKENLDWFDSLMTRWAYACRVSHDGGLGYSSRTIEGRLQKEGGIIPRAKGSRGGYISVSSDIEQVEIHMARLRSRDSGLTVIMEDRYLKGRDWRTIAKKARCSESNARLSFKVACTWIRSAIETENWCDKGKTSLRKGEFRAGPVMSRAAV